jgi:hypothetical protein
MYKVNRTSIDQAMGKTALARRLLACRVNATGLSLEPTQRARIAPSSSLQPCSITVCMAPIFQHHLELAPSA